MVVFVPKGYNVTHRRQLVVRRCREECNARMIDGTSNDVDVGPCCPASRLCPCTYVYKCVFSMRNTHACTSIATKQTEGEVGNLGCCGCNLGKQAMHSSAEMADELLSHDGETMTVQCSAVPRSKFPKHASRSVQATSIVDVDVGAA